MATTTVSDKQGWLGDLETKSVVELQELLIRQENLLKHDHFIQRLPDKGKRIKGMVEKLKSLLSRKDEVEEASDLFQKMAVSADDLRSMRGTCSQNSEEMQEDFVLREIVNVGTTDKIVEDHRETNNTFQNSVDFHKKVVHKGEENQVKEYTFKPGKSIKYKHIQEIPSSGLENLQSPQNQNKSDRKNIAELHNQDSITNSTANKQSHDPLPQNPKIHSEEGGGFKKTKVTNSKLKYEYDANLMSAAIYRDPKCPTQVISIEESISLLEDQRKKQGELQTKQAAEKLMEGLSTRMVSFDPEGARKMAYRVNEPDDSDDDADCDDKEVDYPE